MKALRKKEMMNWFGSWRSDRGKRLMDEENTERKRSDFCVCTLPRMRNCYKGTDYDGMKQEIVRCATDIYIEQMRQNGGKEDE